MRTSGGNQQDEVSNFVKQLLKVDEAKQRLESLINSIAVASAANIEKDIETVNAIAKVKNQEIKEKALVLSNAEDELAVMLKRHMGLNKAYETLKGNGNFALNPNASAKESMLRDELKKIDFAVQQRPAQQPVIKATTPLQNLVVPQPTRPVKSASAPAQMLSEEERQFRIGFLEIKHFCSNNYYNLMQYEQVNKRINDIENAILKYERTNKDVADIRKEICGVLNEIIGDQKPTAGIMKSKHEKAYDKKLSKLAMCIQQLGGVVANKAYNDLADKAFQKKKIQPEKLFQNGALRNQAPQSPARKNSLTKK